MSLSTLKMGVAYMCQQTRPSLVQIMACCLFTAKLLSEPMLTYCQIGQEDHISKTTKYNWKVFIVCNAFENVCKMSVIFNYHPFLADEYEH